MQARPGPAVNSPGHDWNEEGPSPRNIGPPWTGDPVAGKCRASRTPEPRPSLPLPRPTATELPSGCEAIFDGLTVHD